MHGKLYLYSFSLFFKLLIAWFCNQDGIFKTFMEPRNRFQGINSASLCSLAGRYDNPIPTRFLAPIDCLKIPALSMCPGARSWRWRTCTGSHPARPLDAANASWVWFGFCHAQRQFLWWPGSSNPGPFRFATPVSSWANGLPTMGKSKSAPYRGIIL